MLRYALKLTRNRDLARELAQCTMERALSNAHRYQERGRLNSWLANITFRLFVDSRRAARRDCADLHDSIHGWYSTASNEWVEEREHVCLARDGGQGDSDMRRDMLRALDCLPPAQRRVADLAIVRGYDYREIAKRLRLPLGTVRSRLSRARQMLRLELAAYASGPKQKRSYPAHRAPAQCRGSTPAPATT